MSPFLMAAAQTSVHACGLRTLAIFVKIVPRKRPHEDVAIRTHQFRDEGTLRQGISMKPSFRRLRYLPNLVAIAISGVFFGLSQQHVLTDHDAEMLGRPFRFSKIPIPELAQVHYKTGQAEMVRAVHPSLHHISAIVSFVGAAVALADLDGDGLPNDLLHVDPRLDRVMVAPAPGSEKRFNVFILTPEPLSFNGSTMAPMGCLVGDFNEDGRADILVYYWGRSPIVFEQRADGVTAGVSVLTRDRFVPHELVQPYERWYTSAVTQADLDGDGHFDLIVGNYFPDGSRILDATASGDEQMPHSMSHAKNGGRKHLFLWEGRVNGSGSSARFREVLGVLSDDVANRWTFAIGAADLDGDLLPEIYFVHDWGPDRFLHNRSQPGKLHFELLRGERTLTTPRSKVLGGDSFGGMGIDFGDLNGDGWPDIFVSNLTAPYGLLESHFVFMSTGKVDRLSAGVAPYREAGENMGLARSGWAWDVRLADFDNDGDLEIVQAAGLVKGTVNRWPEGQEVAIANDELISIPRTWGRIEPGDDVSGADHNPFYVRSADGRYHDLATRLGLAEPMCSRGIAIADLDGDGRLDFAVANQWGPSFLFRNTAPAAGAFLGLHLRLPIGPAGHGATEVRSGHPSVGSLSRPAIGAIATVHRADGRRLVAEVDGGTGHSGKRAPDLHFGLGHIEAQDQVRVDLRWRGHDGQIRVHSLRLGQGWHTVMLGDAIDGSDRKP
jgi:hypothetical protein